MPQGLGQSGGFQVGCVTVEPLFRLIDADDDLASALATNPRQGLHNILDGLFRQTGFSAYSCRRYEARQGGMKYFFGASGAGLQVNNLQFVTEAWQQSSSKQRSLATTARTVDHAHTESFAGRTAFDSRFPKPNGLRQTMAIVGARQQPQKEIASSASNARNPLGMIGAIIG